MNFIDTHCHIYSEEFSADAGEEIEKASNVGVSKLVLPAIDSQSHTQMLELAKQHPCCYPLMGLHPTSVNSTYRSELLLVERLLSQEKVYGIGEVGIDLYWSHEYKSEQLEAFDSQIQLSLKHGLPIVVHSRDAFREIEDVLKAYKGKPLFGVFHAFTGDYDTFKAIQALGDFAVGIGGIVTFKNSGLAEVVEQIPLDRIVLETDSPYLAPTPHRGKRNIPSYIPLVAARVAQAKGVSVEDVASQTTAIATNIFKI